MKEIVITIVFLILIALISLRQYDAHALVPLSVVTKEGVIVENERCPAILENIQKHKAIIHKMQADIASLEKELENLENEVNQMDCARHS